MGVFSGRKIKKISFLKYEVHCYKSDVAVALPGNLNNLIHFIYEIHPVLTIEFPDG